MGINRRATLLAGLAGGVVAVGAGTTHASADSGRAADPNPVPRDESAHLRLLRQELNAASAGDERFERDDSDRSIVTAKPLTYVLRQPLIIGGNTALHAEGATFVADYPLKPTTWQADRKYFHSPTPTYPDTIETFASTAGSTLLLNHVPSDDTGEYSAPGNIRVQGGTWDPTAYFIRNSTGEDAQRATAAPAMNALTFQHTHDVEVVGVTVRNVKWWHGVEFNAVRTATLTDSRLEGWIENPTTGLWTGDAVQVDLPQPNTKWAGAPDYTPTIDVRIRDNYCGSSDTHPAWAKLGISHSAHEDRVFRRIWVERNTCDNLKWDAILPMNCDHLVIRENTLINCRGGVYVKEFINPLQTVDVIGNTISVTNDENDRPAVGVIGKEGVEISDVAVYGNLVADGEFRYTHTNFRRPPQQD